MGLTKRFFISLAAEYRKIRPAGGPHTPEHETWADMVMVTANALRGHNGMFNYERFYEACGLDVTNPVGPPA